jgi:hypothetical protein
MNVIGDKDFTGLRISFYSLREVPASGPKRQSDRALWSDSSHRRQVRVVGWRKKEVEDKENENRSPEKQERERKEVSYPENNGCFLCQLLPSSLFYLFWQYWGLDSGFHTCLGGTLPLEPFHEPFFVLGIFQNRVSQTICPGLALNHKPPDLYLPSS